jgi:alkylation response protein AidB-like acyl-CoA dehydrogenase
MTDAVAEARSWAEARWDPSSTVREWWERTFQAGWQFPSWPAGLGGRGLDRHTARRVHEAFAEAGVLGPPFGVAQTHGATVVIEHGSDAQKQRLVPPVALGLESWCQLFSEPNAGSDLAGVRTRAERDGDRWRIEGQKIWTSGAHAAARAILLARTDLDAPKHRGLSVFVISLDQPGVEVRPIRQMNGTAGYFNEVFLTGAEATDDDLVGGAGNGWAVALTTLAFERAEMNARVPNLVVASPGPYYGALDRPAGEVAAEGNTGVPYAANRAYLDARALQRVARSRGVDAWPDVRVALAEVYALQRCIEWLDARSKEAARRGLTPGVEANLIKLGKSRLGRQAQALATRILGPEGLLVGEAAPERGAVAEMVLTVPSFSIAGGTDEIQRNVVAERGLGLPREDDPAKRLPFREAVRLGARDELGR